MEIVKSDLEAVDVKDTKNGEELDNDGENFEVIILEKFEDFALLDFFAKILF